MKEMEDWLYSGDEDVYSKNVLEAKGKQLNEAGTKLYTRFNEWEKLTQALADSETVLQRHIQKHHEEAGKLNKGSVLNQKEHDELSSIFDNFQILIAETISSNNELPKFMDPSHSHKTINEQLKQINDKVKSVYADAEKRKKEEAKQTDSSKSVASDNMQVD